MKTLEDLVVLRRLLVRDIRVSARSVRCVYTVEDRTGNRDDANLIYTYSRPRFRVDDPRDLNLASMMLAQVALNYGLFCEEIVFDGDFDDTDRQFLDGMMENTSREILTNKLLVENKFLIPGWEEIAVEPRERYTAAKLVFPRDPVHRVPDPPGAGKFNPDKYVILSSGGKDSLLTYGLIREMGEALPVFINESGRHWYTALNAYRYFLLHDPATEKPWCNSDRLFNFMLRRLPFIRKDYAEIRADDYPIRLWTVAVFVFGVLPVALREGAGNILVGDEYDTTVTGVRAGIRHYHGLYDQSRYFDLALTRYFRRKGWDISQFSVLRSLSELLIMKILLTRYPELQRHQVSCHAALMAGGRVVPCGKCEKCRRIIGMIRALDGDPSVCGYTERQMEAGLRSLETGRVKQLGSDAAHLYHMLLDKGLLAADSATAKTARPHPEIMKLRFDEVRSRPEELPARIRETLLAILSAYADGVVVREKGAWVDTSTAGLIIREKGRRIDEQ